MSIPEDSNAAKRARESETYEAAEAGVEGEGVEYAEYEYAEGEYAEGEEGVYEDGGYYDENGEYMYPEGGDELQYEEQAEDGADPEAEAL